MRLEGKPRGFWTTVLLVMVCGAAMGAFLIAGLWPVAIVVDVAGLVIFLIRTRRAALADPQRDGSPTPWETEMLKRVGIGAALMPVVLIALIVVVLVLAAR